MAIAMAALVAGKALQGMAQYQSLLDQADALELNAQEQYLQSIEIGKRAEINKTLMKRQADQVIAEQQGAAIASGVDISKGAPLNAMANTLNLTMEKILHQNRITEYAQLISGKRADQALEKAAQTRQAATLTLLSAGLATAGAAKG